jgi:hypothetical protein
MLNSGRRSLTAGSGRRGGGLDGKMGDAIEAYGHTNCMFSCTITRTRWDCRILYCIARTPLWVYGMALGGV